MKKNIITGSIILASASVVSAQGLYDIAPDYTAKESSPIKWTAGLSYGIDDNISPNLTTQEDVSYLHAYVGASLRSITPQTTWDVYATVGGRFYLDAPSSLGDDITPQYKLGFNATHEVSERLRLVSNNYVAYESEPDYENGFAGNAATGDYLNYNSTNSIGYRWTDRLGTYTGFSIRGLDFNDSDSNDRQIYSVFNNFRYNLSEQTILTAGYRYSWSDNRGSANSATNHFITAGIERRLNQYSVFTIKGGVQLRDVNGGSSNTSPYLEAAIRTQVNDQFSLRGFAKYSMEEYGTSVTTTTTYDANKTLRAGVSGEYRVSQPLTLMGGVNYINTNFTDGRNVDTGASIGDVDQDLINAFIGFSYELNQGVFFNGTYNWTTSISDEDTYDYDRNRASLGIRLSF